MEINKKQFNIREVYAITGSLYSNKLVITSMQSQTTLRDASKGIHRVREGSAPDNQPSPFQTANTMIPLSQLVKITGMVTTTLLRLYFDF